MKKVFFSVAVLLFCSFFQLVFAGEQAYISLKAGLSDMKMDDASYYSILGGSQTHRYDTSASDSVPGGGLGLGLSLKWNLRAELEYYFRSGFTYDKVPTNDGIANAHQDLDTHTVMAHLFYDFTNKTAFTPYVFTGAGLAYHKTDANAALTIAPGYTYKGSTSSSEFAWDLGLGTAWNLSDSLSLDLCWRYVDLGEAEWKNDRTDGGDRGGSFADMSANEVVFSLRYGF